MNNVIPFRGRVTAVTPPVRGVVILAFRAKARTTAPDASLTPSDASFRSDRMERQPGTIRGCLRAAWHLNPDTGRLECRWRLSDAGEETDAFYPPCSKCAGTAVGSR
ncbi:hypothetical protein RNI52_24875 [Labrys neptuniae]|uniref:hypothetical protein n=1 Tax=Labrys TaxID=204476 RepID=UPI00288FA0E6|nr:hypothetical protein [Labrys neptuniae]MDT3380582.1 hypothetical protein [Labrys neptuniae]